MREYNNANLETAELSLHTSSSEAEQYRQVCREVLMFQQQCERQGGLTLRKC